jgi:monoamine oxidase
MSKSLIATLASRFDRERVMHRREMLRDSVAAASALLLAGSALGGAGKRRRRSARRTVVVGTGFGGLSAAYQLKQAGHDVTVVEARSRVSGRVVTMRDLVPGKIVEGGGELIGSNHPAWLGYAERFGLSMRDVTEEDGEFPIVLGGRALDATEAESLWEEMETTLAGLNDLARAVDPLRPWEAADAAGLDGKSIGEWIDGCGCGEVCRGAMHALITADNGVDSAEQSLLANLAMIAGGGFESFWTDSEVYRCAQGNQSLAMKLVEEIGAERIQLGTKVTRVERSGRGALVSAGDGVIECDEVVLAVPPSVWDGITFDPPLPQSLRVQMGRNTKHLTVLSRAVWREHGRAPDSLTTGPVQLTWHETDNQDRADEPRVVMTSFAGGSATDAIRTLERGPREVAIRAHLERLYPGATRAALATRDMDWISEPLTRASYSFPAKGQLTTCGSILADGLDRLHFAGEHCCPGFVGYMEGALESGIAVAKRIG